MKAILEFDLPDDNHAFKLALEAQNLNSLVLERHERIRSYLKYGVPEHESPTDWEAVAAEQAMTIALMKAEQVQKPLTEEEMLNIIDDMLEGGSLVDVARAIERAHGIT